MQVSTEITDLNPYQLANMADVPSPDGPESPGSLFLKSVLDDVLDRVDDLEDEYLDDVIAEIADGAPSIYTYQKWQEFVDLAAWQEDVDEFGGDLDMDRMASLALYRIAERLARALFEMIEDEDGDGDE